MFLLLLLVVFFPYYEGSLQDSVLNVSSDWLLSVTDALICCQVLNMSLTVSTVPAHLLSISSSKGQSHAEPRSRNSQLDHSWIIPQILTLVPPIVQAQQGLGETLWTNISNCLLAPTYFDLYILIFPIIWTSSLPLASFLLVRLLHTKIVWLYKWQRIKKTYSTILCCSYYF